MPTGSGSGKAKMPTNISERLIHYSDHVEMPWKNGAGTTREVVRENDQAKPYWRLSLATVDKSGPFSIIPGCTRLILLLEGQPMTLHFDDGEVMPLESQKPQRFSCERPLRAILPAAGERRDLNLIWNDDAFDANVQVVTFAGQLKLDSSAAYRTIVIVTKGTSLTSVNGGTAQEIVAGDTLVIGHQDSPCQPSLSFQAAEAELVLFRLYKQR